MDPLVNMTNFKAIFKIFSITFKWAFFKWPGWVASLESFDFRLFPLSKAAPKATLLLWPPRNPLLIIDGCAVEVLSPPSHEKIYMSQWRYLGLELEQAKIFLTPSLKGFENYWALQPNLVKSSNLSQDFLKLGPDQQCQVVSSSLNYLPGPSS